MPGKRKPTIKQRKFVENVIKNGGNATKAAVDAGYSKKTAYSIGSENLSKPEIQAAINARIKDSQIDTNEIIGTLVSQMRADLSVLFPNEPLFIAAKKAGVSHLIKKAKFDKDTGKLTEIETYCAQSATKHLTSVFGLETEPAKNPTDFRRIVEDIIAAGVGEDLAKSIVAKTFGITEQELINQQIH